jgi:Zn-dependent peptidase ImmA (M78 family)
MPFIPAAVLDARAADLWRRHGLGPGFDAEALLDTLGLGLLWEVLPEQEGERVLGALFANESRVVLNQSHLEELESNLGLRRFTIGHEIGHWVVHAEAIRAGSIALLDNARTWCRSGAADPVERQAEMFAGRLLVPADRLREVLPASTWRGWPQVYELADRFVVTPSAMVVRLEELRLAHRDEAGVPRSGQPAPEGQEVLFAD